MTEAASGAARGPAVGHVEADAAAVVRARVAELVREGARAFDAPAVTLIENLLARADALGGAAGGLLRGRAMAYASRLEERLRTAKRRASALSTRFLDPRAHGDDAETNPTDTIRRAYAAAVLPPRPRRNETRVRTLLAELAQRSPSRVGGVDDEQARASFDSLRLASALYRESLAEVAASVAVARAEDDVPKIAGPYNALAIAARALRRMHTLSPLYLRAQLARLETLAALEPLDAAPREDGPDQARPRSRDRSSARGTKRAPKAGSRRKPG